MLEPEGAPGARVVVPGAVTFEWSVTGARTAPTAALESSLPFEARVHPDDRAAFDAALARACETGEPLAHQLRVVTPEGTPRWIVVRAQRAREAPEYVRGVALELPAPALVEPERDSFVRAILDSLPGVLYLYDRSGRFLRWNANFEAVTGYTTAEMARVHPLDFFVGEDRELVAERIEEVFRTGSSSVAAGFVAKDGRVTPYFFTGVRLEVDGAPCLIGVGIDISQRCAAEAALRELNEALERRVATRTEQLAAALVHAEAADRLKSAFLATMSHELRTPLNSIIGFTGILLEELPGPLNSEQRTQLTMVQASGRHLLELINDVLDLSKIEADELRIRAAPFDPRALVSAAVASLGPVARRKGLALSASVDPELATMVSDRRRVQQVLLNLVNNAMKFTRQGSVTVRLERAAAPSPRVRLSVQDTGIGIAAADLPGLFQPFRQLDAGLARQHDGTGLGLAICQRLTALLGGTIEVASELGVGSTFTVELPLELAQEAA